MPNQQQRPKGRGQTARSGSAARGGQSTGKGPNQRSGQAVATGRRGASASANGAARSSAVGQPAARQPARVSAGQPWTPQWVRVATIALSLIGIGLGIYLTVAHLAGAQVLVCSSKGIINCEAVTTSPESELFGVFPVAELGLAFYVFMALINLPWAWRPEWTWLPKRLTAARPGLQRSLPVLAWRVRLGSGIIGILFILYLIYTELITLRNICLWCTYVHITTFLLFMVLVAQATFWGDPSKAWPEPAAGRTSQQGTVK